MKDKTPEELRQLLLEEKLTLELRPIGIIRTEMRNKFDAPHQPNLEDESTGIIELTPGKNLEIALQDLNSFSHLWLIWWFHRNRHWKPKVFPPRGPEQKRGLFATRSPHRPNPIGITAVKLIKIEANKIYISNNDLVDGTPILDIKPYLPKVDAISEASSGWVGEVEKNLSLASRFTIKVQPKAEEQLRWLEERGINFSKRAFELLTIDPSPHRTRRITKTGDNLYRMGCGGWRINYSINKQQIEVNHISSGYPLISLRPDRQEKILNFNEHFAFLTIWKEQ